MVKVLIGNVTSRIIGYLPEDVHQALDKRLSYTPADVKHIKSVKEGKWDGRFRLYRKSYGQFFDTGLMSMVTKTLDEHGVEYHKADDRKRPEANLPHLKFSPFGDYEERDYQQFTIDRAYKRTRGILKVATGGGKTMMVSELIGKIQTAPFMFYVLTKDLMEQAHENLSSTLNEPIGRIGGGQWDIQKINVCTIQTAVRAVNMENKKFKISDYQFDEEDIWDKEMESEDKMQRLKQLLRATRGLYFDECVVGDSIVQTEKGTVRIDGILENKCRYVLTHDGNNVTYKRIKNFWDKGEKPILEITLKNGENIKCTKDHAILTNSGWKQAKDIKLIDKVLFVNADVEQNLNKTQTGALKNSFWDIKLKNDQLKSGNLFLKNTLEPLLFVNADVGKKLNLPPIQSKCLLEVEEPKGIQNILMDMINSPITMNTTSPLLQKNDKQFLEPAWGIRLCHSPIKDQKTTEFVPLMENVSKNGCNINQNSCIDLELKIEGQSTVDTESSQYSRYQNVYHVLPSSQTSSINMALNALLKQFWTVLELLELHGGYAMTDQAIMDAYQYTLKDGENELIKSYNNGLLKMGLIAQYKKLLNEAKNYITLDLERREVKNFPNMSRSTFLNACNINWKAIKSIKFVKQKRKVYDIEVEDAHCFFANGIMVHNCHHSSAKTCKDVLTASPNAFWRFGGSATPYREDGAEIMLQALFGKKIVDINASYLIDEGFLIEPHIFFEPVHHDCNLHSYRSIYSECVSKNEDFNLHVADTANFLIENNLSTLVLVQHIHHGKYLHSKIPGSVLVTGKLSNKKRLQAIQDLRDKKCLCMIATCLADEGLDIPTLDAALLAGGGASATRVHQRIGRTLRKDRKADNPRDRSIVVYYRHYAKYLEDHALKARRIMKEEPRFNILKSKGQDHILGEISDVMGLGYHQKSIFDL